MTAVGDHTSHLLKAAEHLEKWAKSLPRWCETGQERWYEFLDRRYKAEMKIIKQIQRTPNCYIKTCEMREGVHLAMAGITVRTNQGLEASLLKWVKRARERESGSGNEQVFGRKHSIYHPVGPVLHYAPAT